MNYIINAEKSVLGTKIEITGENDIEYSLSVINQTLSDAQIKMICKSLVEIVEGVFLSEV